MDKPTEKDRSFIKKAAAIFAELIENSEKYTRDECYDGYIAHVELDARTDNPILRMTYVFETVARVRQYWKAPLNEEVPTIYKDKDSDFDIEKDRSKIYDLDDLISFIAEEMISDDEEESIIDEEE